MESPGSTRGKGRFSARKRHTFPARSSASRPSESFEESVAATPPPAVPQHPFTPETPTPSTAKGARTRGRQPEVSGAAVDEPGSKGGRSLRKRARIDYNFDQALEEEERRIQAKPAAVGQRSAKKRKADQLAPDEELEGEFDVRVKRRASEGPPKAAARRNHARRLTVEPQAFVQEQEEDVPVQDTIEVGGHHSEASSESSYHQNGSSTSSIKDSSGPQPLGEADLTQVLEPMMLTEPIVETKVEFVDEPEERYDTKIESQEGVREAAWLASQVPPADVEAMQDHNEQDLARPNDLPPKVVTEPGILSMDEVVAPKLNNDLPLEVRPDTIESTEEDSTESSNLMDDFHDVPKDNAVEKNGRPEADLAEQQNLPQEDTVEASDLTENNAAGPTGMLSRDVADMTEAKQEDTIEQSDPSNDDVAGPSHNHNQEATAPTDIQEQQVVGPGETSTGEVPAPIQLPAPSEMRENEITAPTLAPEAHMEGGNDLPDRGSVNNQINLPHEHVDEHHAIPEAVVREQNSTPEKVVTSQDGPSQLEPVAEPGQVPEPVEAREPVSDDAPSHLSEQSADLTKHEATETHAVKPNQCLPDLKEHEELAGVAPVEPSKVEVETTTLPREEPAPEEPVAEEPLVEEPMTDAPVAKQPAAEDRVAEQASIEQTLLEVPFMPTITSPTGTQSVAIVRPDDQPDHGAKIAQEVDDGDDEQEAFDDPDYPYARLTPYVKGATTLYPTAQAEAEPEAEPDADADAGQEDAAPEETVEDQPDIADEDTPGGTPGGGAEEVNINSDAPELDLLELQQPVLRKQHAFKKTRPTSEITDLFEDLDSLTQDDLWRRLSAANRILVAWQEEYTQLRKITEDEDNAIKYQQDEVAYQTRKRQLLGKDSGANPVRKDFVVKGVRAPKPSTREAYYRQQDKIMANVYGFDYNDADTKVGRQDPIAQRPGASKTRLRDRPKQTAKAAEADDGTTVPGKRIRKAPNLFPDVEAPSRGSTPVPVQATRRKRGRPAANDEEEFHIASSSQVDVGLDETPKRRKGGRPRKQPVSASIPEGPSTPTGEEMDVDEERPSRRRQRKQAVDDDSGTFGTNGYASARPGARRRNSRINEIPSSSFYSNNSQTNDDSRPATSDSGATASTSGTSYQLREKRQKRFSLDETDDEFVDEEEPRPKRVRRAPKKMQTEEYADTYIIDAPAEPEPSMPHKTQKFKIVNGPPGSAAMSTTSQGGESRSTPSHNGSSISDTPNGNGMFNGQQNEHGGDRKDYSTMTKSEKMSHSMKARWASGSMSTAVAKRRATLAAKKAAARTPVPGMPSEGDVTPQESA